MIGALAYLTWRSTVNRLGVRLRRLREPRYLLGAVVGAAWFYLAFFRSRHTPSGGTAIGLAGLLIRHQGVVEIIGAAVLLVLTAVLWILPTTGRPALAFSQADVQLLFPAPITRRELVRYRVLRSQLGAALGSAFMTVVFRPGSVSTGWTFFGGVFLVMTTVNLHFTGVSLRRQSLAEHGASGWMRQGLPIAVVAAALFVVGAAVVRDWPSIAALPSASAMAVEVARVLGSGLAGQVLYPFKILARMPIATTPSAFLRDLPPALAVLAANYLWIERSDVAFEEASAALAERRTSGRGRARRLEPKVRAAQTPFTLGLTGAPEIALVWKNLILLGRYASLRVFARLIPTIVVVGILISTSSRTNGLAHAAAIACLVAAGVAVVLGPQIVRNDLRRDLANLDVIRTWPLRGATVVRGEVLAPTVVLTVMTWLLLLSAAFAAGNVAAADPLQFARRLDYVLGAALVAPGLVLVQLIAHNAIAVAFPAWSQIAASRTRGIDVMGQRLVMLVGLLLVLVVAVLPAAAFGGLVAVAVRRLAGSTVVVVPAAAAAFVLAVEALVAMEAVGSLLDRTDVTALDLGEN